MDIGFLAHEVLLNHFEFVNSVQAVVNQRFERVWDALPIEVRPQGMIEIQVEHVVPPEIGYCKPPTQTKSFALPIEARPEEVIELEVEQVVPLQVLTHGGARPQTKSFAAETAVITGESKSQVNRHIARADALGDDLDKVTGTSLDKGVELDALLSRESWGGWP